MNSQLLFFFLFVAKFSNNLLMVIAVFGFVALLITSVLVINLNTNLGDLDELSITI